MHSALHCRDAWTLIYGASQGSECACCHWDYDYCLRSPWCSFWFFFFLVWMYQGKKQRQEKEAKRFKGKEFSWVVILQSPVTVVNMLVRRNSSWSSVEHLVWVSTYETPWGWQQNRVGRKVPVFLSGLPSLLLRCRWCPETCWPVGTPGPARYWKMAGEDTWWQSVASTHMHTHVLGHLQKPINTHTPQNSCTYRKKKLRAH